MCRTKRALFDCKIRVDIHQQKVPCAKKEKMLDGHYYLEWKKALVRFRAL